jgi:hypothetical protein
MAVDREGFGGEISRVKERFNVRKDEHVLGFGLTLYPTVPSKVQP